MQLKLTAACVLGLLAGCAGQGALVAVDPALPTGDPRQERLVFNECAIYFAAVQSLRADGRRPNGNPTRGCPAEAAARPADINPMVSVPAVSAGFPQELYGRMVARGLPKDQVDDIARSKAFWDLVAFRDSVISGF
ncbi:hypothetical protein [Yoonia vestfoldensis]|uniref:Lipoprotein n=1 Tax=Yoonia vestfoldensis TaxID=245188 RepID=A0A1Y0EAU4_9RHOB|nr:hypothetical protein [Yoonia vestfoldensis]ARU00747.1 hypothetical protein LOKVESSMR4R_01430 [Yoonia vestfoldensis]